VLANPVDLTSLVRRLLGTLTPERMLAGVGIEYEAAPRACAVRGDEQLLAVAIAGLVSAVHALVERTPEASVIVRLAGSGDEATVRVEVSQDILSLPASWRARFFELGWPDRPGGGSVGASVVAARRIAELHGGSVTLSTKDAAGCTLTLSLPAEGQS
jgi:signal transduction histidine kinase